MNIYVSFYRDLEMAIKAKREKRSEFAKTLAGLVDRGILPAQDNYTVEDLLKVIAEFDKQLLDKVIELQAKFDAL